MTKIPMLANEDHAVWMIQWINCFKRNVSRLSLLYMSAMFSIIIAGCDSDTRFSTASPDSEDEKRHIAVDRATRRPAHSGEGVTPNLVKDEIMADKVGASPSTIRDKISLLGPGSERKAYLSTLFREAAANQLVAEEIAIAALEELDKNGYPEDVLSIYGHTADVLRRIGTNRSLLLLHNLRSPYMKREVASALGDLYADDKSLPNPGDLAKLDEITRISIFDSIGSKIAENFNTARELRSFLSSIKQDSKEHAAMIESITNSPSLKIEAEEILIMASHEKNEVVKMSLFEAGIHTMIERAPMAASKYLADNKETIDSGLYNLGVKKLVSYLRGVDDEQGAKAWEAQLSSH